MHIAALTQPPETITNLLILICEAINLTLIASSCYEEFSGTGGLGPYLAQLYAKMSQSTGDMQAWCYYQFQTCTLPPLIQINESDWFSPKPEGAVPPKPSGETINVLHLSDWHIDPDMILVRKPTVPRLSAADLSALIMCLPPTTLTHLCLRPALVLFSATPLLTLPSPSSLRCPTLSTCPTSHFPSSPETSSVTTPLIN